MATPLSIALVGATGRLGKATCESILKDHNFKLSAALASPSSPLLNQPLPIEGWPSSLTISSELPNSSSIDVIINVATKEALLYSLEIAKKRRLPIVIGTTHLTDNHFDAIESTSQETPVLYSTNFSLGIALLRQFIQSYQPLFDSAYIDIIETHRTGKKDCPSGTALSLASLFDSKYISEKPPGLRSSKEISIHSIRAPNSLGDHKLQAHLENESLTIDHKVISRSTYAKGILLSAKYLVSKPPGKYHFSEVLESFQINPKQKEPAI